MIEVLLVKPGQEWFVVNVPSTPSNAGKKTNMVHTRPLPIFRGVNEGSWQSRVESYKN